MSTAVAAASSSSALRPHDPAPHASIAPPPAVPQHIAAAAGAWAAFAARCAAAQAQAQAQAGSDEGADSASVCPLPTLDEAAAMCAAGLGEALAAFVNERVEVRVAPNDGLDTGVVFFFLCVCDSAC